MRQNINFIEHQRTIYFKMSEDNRLSPYHISMYHALFIIWNECGFDSELSINRNDVMKLSKIGNANTYTKVLKELTEFGYVVYKPSYNPLIGSKVTIITFDKGTVKGSSKGSSKGSDKGTGKGTGKGGDTLYKQLNNITIKQLNISERKLKFSSTLSPFLEIYGKEMLNEFYLYWTEPNQSNTKLKFEMEKTWSVERRLITWRKNDDKFYPITKQSNEQRTKQLGELTAELRRNDPTL